MLRYETFTEVTDNGPYITKLILHTPEEVRAEALSPDVFCVYVERRDPLTGELFLASRTWLGPKIYPSRGYRPVTKAYPVDEQGEAVNCSCRICLEMPYGPSFPLGYAQADFGRMNEFVKSEYRVMQVKEIPGEIPVSGWIFDEFAGDRCPQLAGWLNGQSSYEPQPLRYGAFLPDVAAARERAARKPEIGLGRPYAIPEKVPLVIWLHGAGEGGVDPTVAYTGNKVVAMSAPDIQRKLGGAAFVLAPQCPTFWMDDGEGEYTSTGESRYGEALMECIREFVEQHREIDRERIYIGGCSNGGFMTLRMIMDYPDYFAAAYPVCGAMADEWISDEKIQEIKDLPIWFTHAANDPVVPPMETTLPTYRRLLKAGGGNVHVSYFDKVVDRSGLFRDDQGRPYEYMGHFSWVYTYNDDCTTDLDGGRVLQDGMPVSLWQWMGLQKRENR